MSCDCTNSNDEGCAPLPAVTKGIRALARGADGCPVELTGEGIITQSTGGGVYASDGSAGKPLCLGPMQESASPNALVGLIFSNISGQKNCLTKFTGTSEDVGKVVKWDGVSMVLRPLLETLCYAASAIISTCCPSNGFAVWGTSGSSRCLQSWDPCDEGSKKNVTNPKFIVCEANQISSLELCDLPVLVAGTSYQQIVCTEDGPRILGGTGVSSRQFVPFDRLGSGSPVVLPDSTRYNQTNGTNVSDTIDLAVDTGVAIPTGATHVQLAWQVVVENNSNNSLFLRTYVPGSLSDANQRGYMNCGDTNSDDDSSGFSCVAPINTDGTVSWLVVKSGVSANWITSLFCRVEGYWVG